MQVPVSWLRDWAPTDLDTDALAHRLTMAGLEVEEAEPAAPPFSGIVVAHILDVAPHPDADRLRVCQVDDGRGAPLQIVCGAPNAAAGMRVPLARVGAELPDGMKIREAKMRGVVSQGMLCSARELGLSQDHSGLMALDEGLTPGQDIRAALALDDTVLTLKLTPNRADCLSIRGVAREAAALTGVTLMAPSAVQVPVTLADQLPVVIEAPDLCGRFAGRVVKGVNARAQTPAWMVQRLERAGQRSVSALVDISNYLMLELGRPSHVFDLARLGNGLRVRWAREGETLALLNGQDISLDSEVGVIESDGRLVSLAGIMGGDDSAVTLDTTDIYLEAAFWWPQAIMGRTRRYKLASEAAHRFERGVDFADIAADLDRLTALVLDICGGAAGPLDDQTVNLPARAPVAMRLSRCERVLGMPLGRDVVDDVFVRLGLTHVWEGESCVVTPPSYRFDLNIEEDLIEEVARVYGFEQISDQPPRAQAKMRAEPESRRGPHVLRGTMASLGYQEVVNFAFVEARQEQELAGNDDPIRLLNPIAAPLAVMRSSLIGGLLENVAHNARRQWSRVRVFELGRVFMRDASVADGDLSVAGVNQPMRLAGMAWGPSDEEQWGQATRAVDFFDLRHDLDTLLGVRASALRCEPAVHPALHPGRSARLWLDDTPWGWLGELHPRWMREAGLQQAPVVFEVEAAPLTEGRLPAPAPLSRQPVVMRDLAIWVGDGVSYGALLDTLWRSVREAQALHIVRDVRLFDVWRPQDNAAAEKSLALRFWLQDQDATLNDAAVDACMHALLDALVREHGVRLRG